MKRAGIISLFMLLCCPVMVFAQFNDSDNDPASTRWKQTSSSNFRVVYPEGTDSLARAYLLSLEKFRPMVAPSLGMVSGQFLRRPLDVILHTRNAASNGSVSWTPSRMEMFTVPEWDNASAQLWMERLTLHEGRHAAQMQMGYRRVFRPFRYILGQIVPGAVNVYPGSLLLEGDAVVAETALSKAGRGRDARFLERYMYSLDNGDTRSYAKWRYGSLYRPAPNNYALGYAMISGARVLWDAPYFMADYLDYVGRRPYDPWPLRHALRRASGNLFRQNFSDVMNAHYSAWAADTLDRAPFVAAQRLSGEKRIMTEYHNPNAVSDSLVFWVKKDIYHPSTLVSMDEKGRERRCMDISSYMGRINSDSSGKHILWEELHYDPRWKQVAGTVIREYDIEKNRARRVSHKGNYAYPIEVDSVTLAVTSYLEDGSEALVCIDRRSGREKASFKAPEGMQLYAIEYSEGEFYAVATVAEGMGIWRIITECPTEGKCSAKWEVLLPPIPVQIESIVCMDDGTFNFESDRDGSMELYSFDESKGEVTRLTSLKYGGQDFELLPSGDVMLTQMTPRGNAVYRVTADSLQRTPVKWEEYYHYKIADALSAQEDTLVFKERLRHPVNPSLRSETVFSEPKAYRKIGHLIRFHSWAPLYVDQDAIEGFSGGNLMNAASLGATAWFQNSMSTLSGQIAYKAAPSLEASDKGKWFHSGHLKLTYKGLYPVFEFQLHVNERNAHNYEKIYFQYPMVEQMGYRYYLDVSGKPFVSTSLRSYIPLQWNRGNWYFGFVPQVGVSYNNDALVTADSKHHHNFLFNAGARAYALQSTPKAAVYPRYGAGVEARWLDPYAFVYMYGYLPGICCGQGLRLSATAQWDSGLATSQIYTSGRAGIIPRGIAARVNPGLNEGLGFTADYAAPFYMGDWNIGSAFLCHRGIITPFFDFSSLKGHPSRQLFEAPFAGGTLWSAGFSFEMDFGAFFWVKTPVRIGFTYSYSGGSAWGRTGLDNPHYVGVIFNIEIPS